MILIKISNLKKSFNQTLVLDQLNLTIHKGKINIILGPSGCGKSTLLNIISGLDTDFQGSIEGIDYNKISYVFQEDRLLNWRNVYANILFALSGKIDQKKLEYYGGILGLTEYWNHHPNELSGGLRQRVNLLRAFLYPSSLLLMDEPFKSLDIKTKEDVIQLFLKIQEENHLTVLLVTHDLKEAVQFGDYIHLLSNKPAYKVHTFIQNLSYSVKSQATQEDSQLLQHIENMLRLNK